MTLFERQQLIAAITTAIETVFDGKDKSEVEQDKTTEMLTVHEAARTVKGLSEHTVRQLVAQGKVPSIRTGAGKNGKILIPKAALLDYCNGARLVG
ncbi:MAG: helix-turn-helix domain-containing protein [Oscillospiraceae bacterium]|nr:helix-turn-helix domain-containing protein [Oscillospiraceae bacterium]